MVRYEILEAALDMIKPGAIEHGKQKFSIIVDGEDGNKYQIKLNEHKQRHNINEFIAHYVGSCSGMPLVEGAFLYFDDNEMKKLKAKLDKTKSRYKSVDIDMMKQGIFFGVKWEQNHVRIRNEGELMPLVSSTSNFNEFFSLFSFDQYLKNHDRHPGNHLVTKERNVKRYRMIDFDRIFDATNWSKVTTLMDDFTPVCSKPYHAFLVHQVDSETIRDVHAFAGAIQSISDDAVQDMCDIISEVYDVHDQEVRNIYDWMTSRKEKIVMKCFENEHFFPNVRQRGLYSVDRQAQ